MKYFACPLLMMTSLMALLASSVAHAQSAAECAQIENARERLTCFDRIYPRDDSATSLPKVTTEVIPVPGAETPVEQTVESAPEAGQPTAGSSTQQRLPAAEPGSLSKGGLLGWDPGVNLTTTIKSVRRKDQQKMVFLLENDEVWLQVSPRRLPIYEGDEVTIKNATIGGYMLRTAGGTTTRVTRIQ
ncbi:MAG: hypothetical protein O7F71_02555 [Gammaproteobacteria bacterium]|nr:hypothetical protein [Gammaproteobacteria bacterium]